MTLTNYQQIKFADWQGVIAALSVADLEASTWALIKAWDAQWMDYIKSETAPGGSDRPPVKPPHP